MRACRGCRRLFESFKVGLRQRRKFCRRACYLRFLRTAPYAHLDPGKCQECGEAFRRKKRGLRRSKFCSSLCRWTYYRTAHPRIESVLSRVEKLRAAWTDARRAQQSKRLSSIRFSRTFVAAHTKAVQKSWKAPNRSALLRRVRSARMAQLRPQLRGVLGTLRRALSSEVETEYIFGELGFIVDGFLPELCVCIEFDGREHRSMPRRIHDALRDELLLESGISVVRVNQDAALAHPRKAAQAIICQIRQVSGTSASPQVYRLGW